MFAATKARHNGGMRAYFAPTVPEKAKNLFNWIEWVVMTDLPLYFVEDPYTRKNVRLTPISERTLIKYINKITDKIDGKLRTDRHNNMPLTSLEEMLYLKENKKHWDVMTVAECLNQFHDEADDDLY
jgi:molybdopterin-biosynthesis enzyme MoeA-like protein